jgi:hypothetical protein
LTAPDEASADSGKGSIMYHRKTTRVYSFNPLDDPRWPLFLAGHPESSVFHTREWLRAIRTTYGYEPLAFTTSAGEKLRDAVVFCQIKSWLTGRRLVSLPFSDHCQPLAEGEDLRAILAHVHDQRRSMRYTYVEIRPVPGEEKAESSAEFRPSNSFRLHGIDLRPELADIYRGFHDSCVRRKIKRAEKESLVHESGTSEDLLQKFRHLLLLTRRRHKLPPQPAAWFQNIVGSLGDMATIHVASKGMTPIASILTLRYKNRLIYKYGCSDSRFSNMGGTPFLFWKAVQQAKEFGVEQFDLGRSDHEDEGLIAFKEHLGAVSSDLIYLRNPAPNHKKESTGYRKSISSWGREALVRLPDPLLAGVGQLLYRHMG